MTTAAQVRRRNLATLIAREGGQAALARRIGKDKNQVNQWLGRAGERNMSDATARGIERSMMLPEGWLDQPQDAPELKGPSSDPSFMLENEVRGIAGLLSILLCRLGSQSPAEGAAVALELRRFLAKPGYEGEVLPTLLRELEASVPSFVPGARRSGEASEK